MNYKIIRSVSDKHLHIIFEDGHRRLMCRPRAPIHFSACRYSSARLAPGKGSQAATLKISSLNIACCSANKASPSSTPT